MMKRRAMTHLLPALMLASSLWLPEGAAAAVPPVAAKEVEHLLQYVSGSGCEFSRNGSWYDAKRGEAHLRTKYDYLAARGQIAVAEDFIDKGASKSSFSGLDYQVKCGNSQAITSNLWLRGELAHYRATLR
jgi:hypothetical protein